MSTAAMSPLQVNSSDVGGGAERVMTDLHEQYLQRGIDSWMAVGRKHSDSPRVLEIPNDEGRSAWARTLIGEAERLSRPGEGIVRRTGEYALRAIAEPARYVDILSGVEDMHFPATPQLLDLPPTRPDVLHLHNLHGYYFDLRQLPALSSQQPTILTLHDTWLLTGHCAHPFDCPKSQTGCGGCADLGMYVPIRTDASARNWRVKHDLVKKSRLAIATPSEWLMRTAQASGIAENAADARVIPNGVDTSVFTPGDRLHARAMLGLPADRKIILFSATDATANPFKDFATLVKALSSIAASESNLLLVALGAEGVAGDIAGVETRRVPFVTDKTRIARYYQAADLYVHAARAESFGLTIVEAMACGTPVIATAVGGIPEIIMDGQTGLLVRVGDVDALRDATTTLLGDAGLSRALAESASRRVSERFTIERQANAYTAWYEELLGRG